MQPAQRGQVDALGRAEQRLEVLGQLGLGEEREDPTAVVVDHHEGDVVPRPRAEQAVAVVQEAEVAGGDATVAPEGSEASAAWLAAMPSISAASGLVRLDR